MIQGGRAALPALAALTLAACQVDGRFLQPDPRWLAEPGDFALPYQPFELARGSGDTVHGWFIESQDDDGSTVILCHGSRANISFLHPYYRFLNQGGHHVVVFDYRGYGKSRGAVDLGAVFEDTEAVLAHVAALPQVDADQIALFGVSLGSIAALRTAAGSPQVGAVILEDVVSPQASLEDELGALTTALIRFLWLPGDLDPLELGARLDRPALFLVGAWDPGRDAHLAAAEAARGPTASWMQPQTGHAPEGLLRHDREYQAQVLDFLDRAFDDDPANDGAAVRVTAVVPRDPHGVTVTVARRHPAEAPLPVEIGLVDAHGLTRFEQVWLHEPIQDFHLDGDARAATAWSYRFVDVDAETGAWRRQPGPLARADDTLRQLSDLARLIRTDATPWIDARAFVAIYDRANREFADGLPALAATEAIPHLVTAGEALLASEEEGDRAAGRLLLRAALDAEPAQPHTHYWPADPYRAGFSFQDEVARARALLAGDG